MAGKYNFAIAVSANAIGDLNARYVFEIGEKRDRDLALCGYRWTYTCVLGVELIQENNVKRGGGGSKKPDKHFLLLYHYLR